MNTTNIDLKPSKACIDHVPLVSNRLRPCSQEDDESGERSGGCGLLFVAQSESKEEQKETVQA